MSKKNSKVLVEVIGGLGNQLFCYAAGAYLAKKTDAKLFLDISKIGVGAIDHGKTILNFQLDCEIIEHQTSMTMRFRFIRRVSNKLASHSHAYRKLRDRIEGRYTANSLGYEDEFAALNQARRISGYFQSYIYADYIREELKTSLILRSPSSWFKGQEELIYRENPVVIHMRRGDYLEAKDNFGVLAVEYYEEAFSILSKNEENRRVWIFTDSPEFIRNEIANSKLQNSSIVSPPSDSNPNESMILMSRASDLVISNSTFSWWAAYIAREGVHVVAPKKWFRQLEDPALLLPDHWIKLDSQWSD